jgi:hypothetical protein
VVDVRFVERVRELPVEKAVHHKDLAFRWQKGWEESEPYSNYQNHNIINQKMAKL